MRKYLLPIIILFVAVVFLVRLFFLQVIFHEENTGIDNIAIETVYDYPERGYIYDRNGELLVSNQPAYDVMVVPSEVKTLDTLELCGLLEIGNRAPTLQRRLCCTTRKVAQVSRILYTEKNAPQLPHPQCGECIGIYQRGK